MKKQNLYQLLSIPENVMHTLFLIAFAVALSPFASGLDFGFVQIPNLSTTNIYFRAIGPIFISLVFFSYVKIWPSKLSADPLTNTERYVRNQPNFAHFAEYTKDANEIFISAISHGYLTDDGLHSLEAHLLRKCDIKILIVDPELPPDAFRLIAEHDERSEHSPNFIEDYRREIKRSIEIFQSLEKLPNRQGSLEVKISKGIPVFTITIKNSTSERAEILIELRPYKTNTGPRPWFVLYRHLATDRSWFEVLYRAYYEKLWNDSKTIVKF